MDVYCAYADTGALVEETATVHGPLAAGYRPYRRDEKGDLTEADDHLMRATGLMLCTG